MNDIMGNYLEDELVDAIVDGSDAERVLGYRNVRAKTEQLFRLYDKGHKTSVLSSNKITDRFVERLNLSGRWNEYAPLYTNRSLSNHQVERLINRFENERGDDRELLLRVYLFSSITFKEALERISQLNFDEQVWSEADLFVEARLEDIKAILMEADPVVEDMPEPELREQAFIYARDLLLSFAADNI